MMIEIYNEDCFLTMKNMSIGEIDLIITSPFYNTNKKAGNSRTTENTKPKYGKYNHVRYDVHIDNMSNDQYFDFTENLFNEFERILKTNGIVLYNLSYGSENTECMIKTINRIITNTEFTIADIITWKKKTAIPNNCSKNKLTRITEYIFVLCRKSEFHTFNCNKRIVSYRKTGQAQYENVYNIIEAKNNDGACELNKATFSSELVKKLLNIYANENVKTIYDPFMGTGTTAVACAELGFNCIGSEISKAQCYFANERLKKLCL